MGAYVWMHQCAFMASPPKFHKKEKGPILSVSFQKLLRDLRARFNIMGAFPVLEVEMYDSVLVRRKKL